MVSPVFGVTGWKNSGKTTLAAGLLGEFTRRGYVVTAIKHAHESFDIDRPGTDSFRLRAAGAQRVVLSSPRRWAVIHEVLAEPEARLEELLTLVGTCDLVIVEGFKNAPFPKLEIRRDGAVSRIPLAPGVSQVVAVASDRPNEEPDNLPTFHMDDLNGMADFVIAYLKLEAP